MFSFLVYSVPSSTFSAYILALAAFILWTSQMCVFKCCVSNFVNIQNVCVSNESETKIWSPRGEVSVVAAPWLESTARSGHNNWPALDFWNGFKKTCHRINSWGGSLSLISIKAPVWPMYVSTKSGSPTTCNFQVHLTGTCLTNYTIFFTYWTQQFLICKRKCKLYFQRDCL